jgi:hypothetical protein
MIEWWVITLSAVIILVALVVVDVVVIHLPH